MPINTRFSEYGSAYGDTWKAKWQQTEGALTPVSVRVLRTDPGKNDLQEKYQREISAWHKLQHSNIAELLGTVKDFGLYKSYGMVSPWMENGNLSAFLEKKNATISITERFQILCDVISGIVYVHQSGMLHGDITGSNIFIDGSTRAHLIGFGLSSGFVEYSTTIDKKLRWKASELVPTISGAFDDFKPVITPACDVFSYGRVMLQTISGKVPYHEVNSDAAVLVAIAQGIHPHRPDNAIMPDHYWQVISKCWEKPESRPSAEEISHEVYELRHALNCAATTASLL
ncbi:hypothetical protein HWV62_28392 [Athelia sp. TMB]|nr:hypothetical protein HWV62_28392 [Athelia sp. TMB]